MKTEDIMKALEIAWPKKALEACGVDFVRDEAGLPKPLLGGIGTGATLVSLDWGFTRDIWLTGAKGRVSGGELSDRFDQAIGELREPPPLWVDP